MGIQQIPLASSGLAVSDLVTQPTWTTIASQISDPNASSVTFSNIPSTYRKLKVIVNGVYYGGGTATFGMRLNGDSNNNYMSLNYAFQGYASGQFGYGSYQSRFELQYGSVGSGQRLFSHIEIENYANSTDKEKMVSIKSAFSGSTYDTWFESEGVYRPSSASAISSLTILSANILSLGGEPAGIFLLGAK
jgi:hypothetical protein